jgi:hypothetical protein
MWTRTDFQQPQKGLPDFCESAGQLFDKAVEKP